MCVEYFSGVVFDIYQSVDLEFRGILPCLDHLDFHQQALLSSAKPPRIHTLESWLARLSTLFDFANPTSLPALVTSLFYAAWTIGI